MKNRIYWTLVTLIVFCMTATAQEGEDNKELVLDLGDLNRLISDLTADIEGQVGDLGELLDLEAMEEEVCDLIDANKKERKIARALLEEFRSHWVDGKSVRKGDGNMDEINAQAEELLPSRKADLFTDWLMERDERLNKRIAKVSAMGQRMGEKARRLADVFSDDAARRALEFNKKGELYAQGWAEYAKRLAQSMAKDSARSTEAARKLGKSCQFRLQRLLSDKSLKELGELAELGEQDWKELTERIEQLSRIQVNGMDLNEFMENINEMVEQSVATGLEAAELSDAVNAEDLASYAEEMSRAAEAYRRALDLKRSERSEKSRSERSALREALRAAGLRDREGEALREYYEQSAQKKEEENKYEAAKKALMRNLKEQEQAIQSRDTELRSLRDEIKDLKREVEKLRREQRSMERKRRERPEEEGTFL